MSNFEDRFLAGLDKKRQTKEFLHPNIEKARFRTEQLFKKEEIQMEDFVRSEDGRRGVYSKEEIEADRQKAAGLKKKFRAEENETQRNLRAQAEVAEGLIFSGALQRGWFGTEATPLKTSEFDDYIHGVDLMIEFGAEGSLPQNVLGLMVDVTFAADRNTGALDKKIDRIKKEIEEGHLAGIKYFKSKNDPRFMGQYQDLPRVVIGMERSKVLELATLWVNEDRTHELNAHPVQRMILDQVVAQLKAQADFAESIGNERITDILRKELRVVQSIRDTKNIPLGDMRFDQVHRDIINATQNF